MMELRDYLQIAGFAVTVALGLVGFGGILYSLRRVVEDVKEMEETVEETRTEMHVHHADETKHVNHLYMRELERRITAIESGQTRIETEMRDGHKRIEDKLDRLTARIWEHK